MGIFDFLKGSKKPKSELTDNEKIDSNSMDSAESLSKQFSNAEVVDIYKDNNSITLTEDEKNWFIKQEINERFSKQSKFELNISNYDPLFEEAARIIVNHQQGSASLLQRKLKLGYNRAGKLIDQLEEFGIISSFDGKKARTVYVPDIYQLEKLIKNELLKSDKKRFFTKHILPLNEELISAKVQQLIKEKEIEEEIKLREQLKQEILEKENERLEKEKRRKLKTQIRKELIQNGIISKSNESHLKRESIPQEVQDKVWNRDGGKCVKCGSQEKIEFDHIIPFSKGGSNTYRNLQILCEKCNRGKSNNIG